MAQAIKGRRVLLRALEEADAPAVFEAVSESRELLRRRFQWARAAEGVESAAGLVRAGAETAAAGSGETFGIFEAKSGRLLGVTSLDRVTEDNQRGKLSVWVRVAEQEKGFAVEAGRLLVERAFKKRQLHRLYARIDPTNRAARKVLQHLGFRYEGCLRDDKRLNGRWIDQECWGMLRADWKK